MKQFHTIALTHRNLGLDVVGKFHIEAENQAERFKPHLESLAIGELMMLSTCNRVEFFVRTTKPVDRDFLTNLLETVYPNVDMEAKLTAQDKARVYNGLDAVRHLFHVASSLDSLIVGEREIITQVRKAYERANEAGMTNHFIKLAVQKAIECAKQVYTDTNIATKPISVVNLGFRELISRELNHEQSLAFVGAGQTIEAVAANLQPFKFKEIKVFNRTKEKAEKLARNLGGKGFDLRELNTELEDVDILVTCTGSHNPVIDATAFISKARETTSKKIVLDLAVPNDVHPDVLERFDVDYISVESLREVAKTNLKTREKEVFRCEELVENWLKKFDEEFRTRKLELAMRKVPQLMKKIKTTAVEHTFASQLAQMNKADRHATLEMLEYLEKKYVSIPMKLAKEVILDKDLKDAVSD